MRKLGVILVIIILAGCSPTRRLARLLERHPLPADTVVETHIVYETDTLEIQLPGDTVEVQTELEVPIDLPDTTITAETDFAEASAGLLSNILWLELRHKDVPVPVEQDSAIKIVYKDRIINQPYPVIEKAKPFYKNGFFILAGLILIGMILLLVLRK